MNKEKFKEKLKKYQTYVLALLLVVSVVGITYAGFVITRESGENTLTTGQISMSYTEPDNAYVVENALPIKDSDGIGINKYFEFTVSSHARTDEDDATGVTVPYNVTLGRLGIESDKLQLLENQIKVYVTKVESGVETVVLQPTLISSLAFDEKNNYIALAASDTHKNGSETVTTTYRLRAWIDYKVEASNFTKDNRYQYKFNVNVNSKVDAIGNTPVQSGTLLVEAIKQRGTVTTGDGLYMSNETNSGDPTYYYRGQVENNYIKLSEDDDMVWRVVRINEDGTTRIILENSPLTDKNFNPSYNDNSYMYYTNSNVEGGAMKTLNDWYDANLSSYDSKIATSTYCESLIPRSGLSDGDSYESLDGFKCPVDENKKSTITAKVGLVSLVEVMYAGGVYGKSNDFYLVDGKSFWTTTPAGLFGANAITYYVGIHGDDYTVVNYAIVNYNRGLRPVISLNANALVKGSGTDIDPWIVK